ncbi:hypothetical protein [Acrocarpospora catenulata]|uniref:hypothetical protein n=1 Tax=Acrocarpospora catenulata TaxID=2836182 RepID=UPI001BDA1ED8|nr:hypothetical protein [Acrocarpospora catenulata]
MIALIRFRFAAFVRSHRVFQPVLGVFVVLGLLYASGVPLGNELSSYADSAAILVPVFAWAARGLLDNEPDEQRMIARAAVGRGEQAGGLVAAFACNLLLAAFALVWPLLTGFAALPGADVLLIGALLHLLSVIGGTVLGALTSRPLLPSPAISLIALLGGYIGILVVGSGSVWVFPAMSWMRAANHGELTAHLPAIIASATLWSLAGLAAYGWLRRTRP